MAFSGMINLKSGQLTLGGQFEAYKRGQLERKIQSITGCSAKLGQIKSCVWVEKINLYRKFTHCG